MLSARSHRDEIGSISCVISAFPSSHAVSLLPRQQFYKSFPQLHRRLPRPLAQVHPLLPLHPGVGGQGRLTSVVEFPQSESQS